MQNPDITILKTDILSNNWYTLNKVTFTVRKRTELRKSKAEKLMTVETERLFCSITKYPTLLF